MARLPSNTVPNAAARWLRQPSARRLLYLDLFRGLAVISMIQGHTFTALLEPSAYGGTWPRWYTLIHGLTAPMFLAGGGLAYGVVMLRSETTRARLSSSIVRRALTLFAVGYALQVPSAPWATIFARQDMFKKMWAVGPLQLVGACLLACELLRVVMRTRSRFLSSIVAFATLVAVLAPFSWQAHLSERLALPIGTWFDGYAGSLFPFFPWAAFFLIGVLLARPAMRVRERALKTGSRELGFAVMLLMLGCGIAWLTYRLYAKGLVMRSFYGEYELWHTSPLYLLFRAGLVLASLGLLCAVEPYFSILGARSPWLGRTLGPLSRQSLVAYVFHLLVLYGTPFTASLVRLRATLSLGHTFAIFVALVGLTMLTTRLWERYVTSGIASAALRRVSSRALSAYEGLATNRRDW